MELVPLGASGLLVSRVGLGCNAFGARVDRAGTRAVVDAALDAGITHFDTAASYGGGDSERFLGDALRRRRHEVVIATKFARRESVPADSTRPQIRRALDESLGRLGTDYVDLYIHHFPSDVIPVSETLGALAELADEGKIRHLGCSNYGAERLREAIAGPARVASLQNEYNLLDRTVEPELLPLCREHGVGVVSYRPLARGLLTETARHTKLEAAPLEELGRRQTFQRFAAAHGRTLLELAVTWLATRPGVSSVIAGASSPEQVRANAAAADWQPTADELDLLDGL